MSQPKLKSCTKPFSKEEKTSLIKYFQRPCGVTATQPSSEGDPLEDCSVISGWSSATYSKWLPLFVDEINRRDADSDYARMFIRTLWSAGRLPACQMASFFLYVSCTVNIEHKRKIDAKFIDLMKDSESERAKLQPVLQRLASSLEEERQKAQTLYNFPTQRVNDLAIVHLLMGGLGALAEIGDVTRSSFVRNQLNSDLYAIKKWSAAQAVQILHPGMHISAPEFSLLAPYFHRAYLKLRKWDIQRHAESLKQYDSDSLNKEASRFLDARMKLQDFQRRAEERIHGFGTRIFSEPIEKLRQEMKPKSAPVSDRCEFFMEIAKQYANIHF
jgi:hypothetical protein